MKAEEVSRLSDEELERRLGELEQERFNMRFQKAVGQLENPIRLRQIRKDIARIKTVQRQRTPAAPGAGGARK